ncbi:MAG: protein BatD [Acidobacteriia bacterium]|nr:protein BatD [Terriglobia bacterium]MYG04792.1 protein BatD [Terriglobia bacterium]MYK10365.1 protein BatD [Terriglobia bacterium]
MSWRNLGCALLASAAIVSGQAPAQDEPLQAAAAVQSRQIYVGQHFLLQIQVQGTDQPDAVDISPLEDDFTVSEAGGGASNSTSVSIINGRMTQQVQRGYNFNYRLAARRAGNVQIPALLISAGGRSVRTAPIALRVMPPQENDDFKLRLSLSDSRAYVGQPVTLTVEWYLAREVREYSFTMPLLEDRRFEIVDPPTEGSGGGSKDEIEIQLGDRRATGRTSAGQLDGRQYTVLRFQKLLIPREAGSIRLPQATVTFTSPQPGQQRRRGLFDDFFGGGAFSGVFGGRPVMETLAIPSGRPSLEVLELPSAGRPRGFNGWIGKFELSAEATPANVKVGEPITLRLDVNGSRVSATLPLPALDQQSTLVRDFRVPREIGAGESRDGALHFTQTLRARHDAVDAIPPIELPYFDPDLGEYAIATSQPIPLSVEPSRIVTAEDAEGLGSNVPRQLEVESSEQGIGHNYTDAAALVQMQGGAGAWLRPLGPMWLAVLLLGLPPLAYGALLAGSLHGQSKRVFGWRSRSPHARWRNAVGASAVERWSESEAGQAVLAALREYFGARLEGRAGGAAAWTYSDIEAGLAARFSRGNGGGNAVDADSLALLRSVFERCEASTYAGGGAQDREWVRNLVDDANSAVLRIEEALR